MSEHISKQFDHELENVRARVLHMGGMVEEQILRALQALTNADLGLSRRVIEDDHRINSMEVALDEECCTIIARRQPTAGDLRLLMAVIKTITDLERIGDEAQKIARMSELIHSSDRMPSARTVEVKHVATVALEMLRMALDAFARLDVSTAAEVVKRDQQVDEEFRSILRQLITFMMEDPRTISTSLDIVWAAKAIERIGDEATKIARAVKWLHEKGAGTRMHRVPDVQHSGEIAVSMLRRTLDAFARMDTAAAAAIIKDDQGVDDRFRAILRQLITFMMEDPRTISTSLDIVWAAKAIERIGDHAKNIAEFIIFISQGVDMRHMTPDEVERALARG